MLHIATTAPNHVSLFDRTREIFGSLLEARRVRAQRAAARRAFLRLAELDDRTLDDIGISRAEVYAAAELPLEVNASLAVREMSAERRRRELRRHR